MNQGIQIITFVVLGLTVFGSMIWVMCDARRRDRSAVVVALLCLLTWPLGFLFWRVVRPPQAIRNVG